LSIFFEIDQKNESTSKNRHPSKINLRLLLSRLNNSNNADLQYISEMNKNQKFFNILDTFFKKNKLEKENLLETMEKSLFQLIKTVDKLEEIFFFLFQTLKKSKNIEFNLKNILINEIWNYLIRDEFVLILIKFSRTNENYKFITLKQKEYIELIVNGVMQTFKEYQKLKKFLNLKYEIEYDENIQYEYLETFQNVSPKELSRYNKVEIIETNNLNDPKIGSDSVKVKK